MAPGMRMAVGSIALALAMGFTCLGQAEKSTSFLTNGSFEEQADGKPTGWQLYTIPERPDLDRFIGVSADKAKEGKCSLKLALKEVPNEKDLKLVLFNTGVSPDVLQAKGKTLTLSGWVFTDAASPAQKIVFRVRTWGPDEKDAAKTAFYGDVISVTAEGKPGEWVKFEGSGVLDPKKNCTSLDMQCGWHKLMANTTQYVDDVQLTAK
jgi:hypothetical protein